MYKVNSPVNFNGANWHIEKVSSKHIELRSTSKNVTNVVVDKPYFKHIHNSWK